MAAVTVSLEWLLAQDDLGLRLVAGVPAREQLTWAHASDLVDPTAVNLSSRPGSGCPGPSASSAPT